MFHLNCSWDSAMRVAFLRPAGLPVGRRKAAAKAAFRVQLRVTELSGNYITGSV